MAFPTFTNTPAFQSGRRTVLEAPSGEAMSYEGTIQRTVMSFAVLLAGAAVGWFVPGLALPAVLIGLVLGLVIAFKRISSAPATLTYSGVEGVVVGAVSAILESIYPGVASQAVLATLVVFGVILFFFSRGTLRTTPRLNKIFVVAAISYALFSLVNLGLMLTGVTSGMFGLQSDMGVFGIVIGILATLLASYSLVIDFEFVKNGVDNRADSKLEWLAAFSLIGTIVWLYLELIRLFSMFRS
jgi:uncharacterized YccA/Bax inhibitor family protein